MIAADSMRPVAARSKEPPISRRSMWVTGVLVAMAALWAGVWRIGTTTILFDEPIYTTAGREYIQGDLTANLEHPPLAKFAFGLVQVVLGDGIESARVASALASVAIALIVWRFATSMFGRSTGLVAVALWVALPRSIGSDEAGTPGDRLERFAYLEPITAMFMVLALWFGWRVHQRRQWLDVVGLGAAIGLAAGSKLSGASVALPAAAFLLAFGGRKAISLLGVAGAVSIVTFFGTYIPFGRTANESLSYMYDFQRGHGIAGHAVYVNGQVTSHPPWYTELWYHLDADGPWLTAAVVVLAGFAFVLPERRQAAAYALGAVLMIYLFLSLMPIEIRHYRFVVWPPLVVLIAAGTTTAITSVGTRWRAVGAVAVIVVVIVGSVSLVKLATIAPEDYAALDRELIDRGVPPDAHLVIFGPGHVAAHHLPGWFLESGSSDVGPGQADVVLVDNTYTVRFGRPVVSGVVDSFRLGRVEILILE